MDFAESVAVPDHRLAVPTTMRVVVIPRVGIRPASAIVRLTGFAHGERYKIALHPQHP